MESRSMSYLLIILLGVVAFPLANADGISEDDIKYDEPPCEHHRTTPARPHRDAFRSPLDKGGFGPRSDGRLAQGDEG